MSVILRICAINIAVYSFGLFEKNFISGYQFLKIEREGGDIVYRIGWKDVVLLLESPMVKSNIQT